MWPSRDSPLVLFDTFFTRIMLSRTVSTRLLYHLCIYCVFVVCILALISKSQRDVASAVVLNARFVRLSGSRERQIQSLRILVRARVDWSRHFITLARSWFYEAGPTVRGVVLRDKYFYLFESLDKLVEVAADYFTVTQSLSFYGHLSRRCPIFWSFFCELKLSFYQISVLQMDGALGVFSW